jgi:NAD(P)-dependent dehydrogenase (short-subunit alcohol dehydrogenase family)
MTQLAGKVALITGAGSGIGQATATLFAHEGAKVVVVDIVPPQGEATVEQIREAGGEAVFVKADVSRPADAQNMIQTAVDTYGRLDILFNNAGVLRRGTIEECTEEDWDFVMAVNLKGVFLGSKYAVPVMKRQGSGVIVSTASGAGQQGTFRSPAYCASKAGVILLMKQLAVDYPDAGIRFEYLIPGVVDTPLLNVMFGESEDPVEAKRVYQERRGTLRTTEAVAQQVLEMVV